MAGKFNRHSAVRTDLSGDWNDIMADIIFFEYLFRFQNEMNGEKNNYACRLLLHGGQYLINSISNIFSLFV